MPGVKDRSPQSSNQEHDLIQTTTEEFVFQVVLVNSFAPLLTKDFYLTYKKKTSYTNHKLVFHPIKEHLIIYLPYVVL